MNTTAIFPTALTAAGLVLLLWIIGRAVTAAGNRIPPAQGRSRHYLAGRISQVRQQAAEMGMFERQLQAVLDRLSARDPGPEHCGRGCICEADLDLAPGQTSADPAP